MRRALLLRAGAAASPQLARGIARWQTFPSAAAAAAPPPLPDAPPPHHGAGQHPLQHAATARGAWQRGSQRQRLPPGALSLIAERQRSSSSGGNDTSDAASSSASSSQHALLATPAYQAALQASVSRTTLSAEQLLEAAAAQSSTSDKAQLLDEYSAMQPLLAAAMAALSRPALDRLMEGWTAAAAERPPGFDSQASLALPGFAEAAVVSRGGRMSNRWKSENQDAFLLELLGSTAGTAGAAGTAGTADIAAGAAGAVSAAAQRQGPLLVGVLDGHGVGGQTASRVAADGIAAELAQRLGRSGGSSTDGSGSDSSSRDASCTSSSSSSAPSQQALVESFQRVAARMQADDAFREGGTAAVVCLVERGSITCAWAGDCRAVAGLSLEGPGGPAFVVHPLTQDHKPDSPQELARVVASGLGRVVRFSPGAPPRLCGMGNPNTLALSRALGDNWALPMGLTAEPDAVTMALPPPAPGAFAQLADDALAGSGGIDSLSTDTEEEESSGTGSSSSGSGTDGSTGSSSGSGGSGNDSGGAAQVAAARHVLLVACDGLWDYVTNQEAVDIALRHDSADAAALALADTARRRWAAAYSGEFVDDITAAVCFIR